MTEDRVGASYSKIVILRSINKGNCVPPTHQSLAFDGEIRTIQHMDSWEPVRQRRLPLHHLRGVWNAFAITQHEDTDTQVTFSAQIKLHALRRVADKGLHSVSIVSDQDPEYDLWMADLDIDNAQQMLSAPCWGIDSLIAHNWIRPISEVDQIDERTLLVTAWHGYEVELSRQFRLERAAFDMTR